MKFVWKGLTQQGQRCSGVDVGLDVSTGDELSPSEVAAMALMDMAWSLGRIDSHLQKIERHLDRGEDA